MKNIVWSFLVSFSLIANTVFALDVRDEYGRTSLMRTVIESEASVAVIQEDISRLWHVCYEYANVVDGYLTIEIDPKTSYSKPVYKREVRRRVSCLDSDIKAHRERERDLDQRIEMTVQTIRQLVELESVAVAATDNGGYTALNYCYTQEIYDELRRCGVPFQWKVWIYFNPGYTTLGCIAAITGTAVGYRYFVRR